MLLIRQPSPHKGNVGDAALVATICSYLTSLEIEFECPRVKRAESLTEASKYEALLYFGNDTFAYYGISRDLIKLFIAEGKPIYLINISYGEDNKNEFLGSIAAYKRLFVWARDSYSQKIIHDKYGPFNEVGLCADIAHLTPDSYNTLAPLDDVQVNLLNWLHSSRKPVLVVNIHSDFGQQSQEVYTQIQSLLDIHSDRFRFLFLPHDSRLARGEVQINHEFFEKNHENSFFTECLTPNFEIFILRQCFAVITCRMHLGILALRSGIPPLIVGYNGVKAKGLLDHWDLEDQLYVNPSKASELNSKFSALLNSYETLKTHISQRYSEICRLSYLPILSLLGEKKNSVT